MHQLLLDLQSGNNEKIRQAETNLNVYQMSNIVGFCTDCATIISDDNAKSDSRQMAGTLLRRTILQEVNSVVGWQYLSKETREGIKVALATLLQSKDRKVKRSAADNISAICAIELPKGEWPNILPNLITNVANQNVDIKEASLMALGFICQLMKERGAFVDKQGLEGIFAGVVGGIKEQNPSINQLAMHAFMSCIFSCQHLFQQQNVRTVVLQQLFNVVQNSQSMDSKKLALQSISEMCREAYFAMGTCIQPILAFTLPLIKNTNEPTICRGAMEIWSALLEQYSQLQNSQYYINNQQAKSLAEAFAANMTIVQQETQDDEEGSIRGSAYRALCNIGQFSGQDICQTIINFVTDTIADSDWKKRQASIKAFTALLDGVELQQIAKLSLNALIQFLKLLNDNSQNVQASAAYSLAKIAQKVPVAFISNSELQNILGLLISCLGKKSSIAKDICSVLAHLFESDLSLTSNIINEMALPLMDALFKTGMRTDTADGSLACTAYLAALMMTIKLRNLNVSMHYINTILTTFNYTYQVPQQQIRSSIHSGILSVLQACVNVVASNQQVDRGALEQIFKLVIEYFNQNKDVDANGIYVLAEISSLVPPQTPYIENIWQYIMHALKKAQDSELFRAALILLSDLSRFSPEKFAPYVPIVLDFINYFEDPTFNNDSKISILGFIGEIFLSSTTQAIKYEQKILVLIEKAMAGCMYIMSTHFDYGDRLRQSIIEAATAIFHGASNKQNPDNVFFRIVPMILQFIKINNTAEAKPSLTFMRESLFLALDIIQVYDKSVKDYFKGNWLLEALRVLSNNNADGKHQDLLDFAKMVIQLHM